MYETLFIVVSHIWGFVFIGSIIKLEFNYKI